MGGIYKITAGQWDANGELVEDDTDYYAHLDSRQVPPPGTMAYLVGILGVPDGIYTITGGDDDSSGGVTDNAV